MVTISALADALHSKMKEYKTVQLPKESIIMLDRNMPKLLYPATTNSIAARFGLGVERKETGKSVLDMVNANDFISIRKRVSAEIDVLWKIYNAMVKEIFGSYVTSMKKR